MFWAIVAIVLMTWIAPPLFNLLLRMDREGRPALSDAQRKQTNWLAGTLLVGALFLVLWLIGVPAMGRAAVYAAVLTIPVTATFSPERGERHGLLAVMTIGLVLAAAVSVVVRRDPISRVAEGKAALNQVKEDLRSVAESPETVAAWSAADREQVEAQVEAQGAALPELKAAADRETLSSRVFLWALVVFTWIASARGAFARSR